MRDQQQPKSFFELEAIIREMEMLEREKEKENCSKSSSSCGHATDSSIELLSESQIIKNEELWVKREDDENIWDNWTPQKINASKKKRKSRKMIFSSLSECPFSHIKKHREPAEPSSDSKTSRKSTTEDRCIRPPEKEQKSSSLKYRKQYVAEFYGTNTAATDAPPNRAFCCEKNDQILPIHHQVHFAKHMRRIPLSEALNEMLGSTALIPTLQQRNFKFFCFLFS